MNGCSSTCVNSDYPEKKTKVKSHLKNCGCGAMHAGNIKTYIAGVTLALSSAVLFSLVSAMFTKLDDDGIDAFVSTFYRGCCQLLLTFIADIVNVHILANALLNKHWNDRNNEIDQTSELASLKHTLNTSDDTRVQNNVKIQKKFNNYEVSKIFNYYSIKNTIRYATLRFA